VAATGYMQDSAQQLLSTGFKGTLLLISLSSQVDHCHPCLACHRTGQLRRNQLHPYAAIQLSHLSVVCLQLVQEFKLMLVLGRRLVFPAQSSAAVSADMTTQVQFQAADGTTAKRTVSLMFPANCRTVVRLVEAWYDAQVSLRMLAGRRFVYIMDGRAAGHGGPPSTSGGGRDTPPHTPPGGGVRVSYPPPP
jgi:hypothetical protein